MLEVTNSNLRFVDDKYISLIAAHSRDEILAVPGLRSVRNAILNPGDYLCDQYCGHSNTNVTDSNHIKYIFAMNVQLHCVAFVAN